MEYKIGDSFLMPAEITAIDADRIPPYFLSGFMGLTGWWSGAALGDMRRLSCAGCKWKGTRHQKCSCCIRNSGLRDNYMEARDDDNNQ